MNLDVLKQKINQDGRFEVFYNELIKRNQKVNLTAITEKKDVYLKHFLDSAAACDFLAPQSYVLDIGCGAGFPSIPLKLLRPDLKFLLIDSSNKKINFVNHIIKSLGLSDIRATHCRVEDLKTKDFDYALARAVAPLNVLCEYALPYLILGGRAIFYKSDISQELSAALNAIGFLGGQIENIIEFHLEQDIKRKLVVIQKIKPSPDGYPRPFNKPRKNPL
ncbi:MAG: 16S rRNA (guanine(527)-N(7))-methyltransferase RsmG [Clostridiales bacterium]|jgi:16S rRNA (guanine527-N7)-methyltransferase|nr:16S rRNA (guanine(527)-N(7))-methyltransferase RsmG [Clostridiales bacterium]